MKFLIQVGTQLDLNVEYNGGAADAGLIYTVPEDNGFITVNISTGVVDAVAEGESVVWVYSGTPSVLVATVVIEVASAATYAERLAIRDGDNVVVVSADEVAAPPSYTLITPQTAIGTQGYAGQVAANAFDGNEVTYWQSSETNGNITQSHIGQQYASVKQVTKVRGLFPTVPLNLQFVKSNDGVNWTVVDTVTVGLYANPENTSFNWLEWTVATYTAATHFAVRPANATPVPGTYYAIQGAPTIDRFRVFELQFFQ
jgi:hypothetical protein